MIISVCTAPESVFFFVPSIKYPHAIEKHTYHGYNASEHRSKGHKFMPFMILKRSCKLRCGRDLFNRFDRSLNDAGSINADTLIKRRLKKCANVVY